MNAPIKIELIEAYIKENKLSKTKFCQISKVSPSTFNKILNQNPHFSLKALFKIARILKVEVWQSFSE